MGPHGRRRYYGHNESTSVGPARRRGRPDRRSARFGRSRGHRGNRPSAISSIGFACVLTGFFLILVFAARLRASLKSAAGGLDWLATAGLAGMVFYLSADIARFMFSDARNLAVGHHVQPAESVAFFDISNALTPVAWAGIAMFLIPSSLSAVRSRALPAWLAWVGLAIGVCQLGLGLVAARRYIDAGRRRLHPLVGSDRFSSRLARPGCDWRAQLKVVPVRTDDR